MNHPLTRCFVLLAVLALVCLATSDAAACPSCKAALAAQKIGQGDLVQGFFWSILFMMSMPFALVGAFGGYMYLLVRRLRSQQSGHADAAANPSAAADHSSARANDPGQV